MSRSLTRILHLAVSCSALCGAWPSYLPAAQLLVTNPFENRVDLYSLTATSATLVQPGFISAGSAGLAFPSHVIVGPNPSGNIYVSSRESGQVLVYDRNGSPVAGPGGLGVYANVGVGSAPFGLAFGQDGLLYVADQNGSSVKIFNGIVDTPIDEIDLPPDSLLADNQPTGLDFDASGNLWISTFRAGGLPTEIFKWNGSSVELVVSETEAAVQGAYGGAGIETTSDGRVIVAALAAGHLATFDGDGNPSGPFISLPYPIPSNANFPSNAPADLIFDGSDILIAMLGPVSDGEISLIDDQPLPYPLGRLLRYTSDGTLISLTGDIVGIHPASSLALFAAVPEPSSVGLGLAGVAVVGCCWYFRRRRAIQ